MTSHSAVSLLVIACILIFVTTGSDAHNKEYKSIEDEAKEVLQLLRELERQEKDTFRDVQTEAQSWLNTNDEELRCRLHENTLTSWAYATDVTDEHEQALTENSVAVSQWQGQRVKEAKVFLESARHIHNKTAIRMLNTWVYGDSLPTADDPEIVNKIETIANELATIYASATAEKDGKTYHIEPEFLDLMAESRDYDELQWAWKTWRDITGPKMRSKFTEVVSYMNIAATDNGLTDVGQSWRIANFEDDDIEQMVDRLFEQILPLYKELHAYVRSRLSQHYDQVDNSGHIPAHILGNMWAQQWDDIYDLVIPFPDSPSYDVTDTMVEQGYTPEKMFQTAEEFFTSIGLEPMTDKFWSESMIVKPNDGRTVQCHGSADDFMTQDDFRIKMCTQVKMDYLATVHHEMGHIEYFMQYRHQPAIFRHGANSAFHEAIGDTIGLSVSTPEHLKAIGLLPEGNEKKTDSGQDCINTLDKKDCLNEEQKKELNFLMKIALNKVAFLPFGYLIDKWRWNVFNGNIDETNYNSKWWQYRKDWQGVKPPVERTENDFDPGAKYHVPNFVPYIRYFLSFIGQFQFQKALCDAAGHKGALNTCDIYKSKDAGDLLKSALRLGSSQPWPEVLKTLTGRKEFATDAIYEYFDPLYQWLKEQNKDNPVGW